ncbi:MAG: hypothetical protein IKA84_05420 [Clostridia bacterium]|nr:hypothetical protein [Clostridia bacterium]
MFFNIFKKKSKKDLWPEDAKYKYRDFVRFRYRGEIRFGFVFEVKVDADGDFAYTIQMGGECPTFAYNQKEQNIIGKVN